MVVLIGPPFGEPSDSPQAKWGPHFAPHFREVGISEWVSYRISSKAFLGNSLKICYDPKLPLRKARYTAALSFRLRVSARAVGFTLASASARFSPASSNCSRRLFQSVFRFWANESLRKSTNPSSATPNFCCCGSIVNRKTVECTFGGGENAPGGRLNSFSTRA